ncbi:Uncharacterised protein g3465 [Pycnogonum litorale]
MIVPVAIALIGLMAFISASCPEPEDIPGCRCISTSGVIVTCIVPSLLKIALKGFSEPQPTAIEEMTIKGLPNKTTRRFILGQSNSQETNYQRQGFDFGRC